MNISLSRLISCCAVLFLLLGGCRALPASPTSTANPFLPPQTASATLAPPTIPPATATTAPTPTPASTSTLSPSETQSPAVTDGPASTRTFWQVGAVPLTVLAFSPDGSLLAVGDEEGTVYLYDFPQGNLRHTLRLDLPEGTPPPTLGPLPPGIVITPVSSEVQAPYTLQLLFSADGQGLYALYNAHSIYRWDVHSAQATRRWDWEWGGTMPYSQALSPSAESVAAFEFSPLSIDVSLWNIDSETFQATMSEEHYTPGLLFSPDSSLLAIWTPPLSIWSWIREEPYLGLYHLDGGLFAEAEIPAGYAFEGLAFSPDGGQLVGRYGEALVFYRLAESGLTLTGIANPLPSPRPTQPDEHPGGEPPSFGESRYIVAGLAFHPSGGLLASLGEATEIILWDSLTLTETLRLDADALVRELAFSPDGHTLAATTSQGSLLFWDIP